jgi:DNA polymerase IV
VQKIILHIDFDSFFASVEQQDNPEFRNKPLGITAHNGRTCIIAASREAKKLGVKSPSRTYEALRICPDLKFATADFVRYLEISKKFLKICQNFSPEVELFSIDEVFMDVTLTNHLFGGVYEMIGKIKKEIKEKIGECITVSVGISYNKLLAKLASGINKPDGVFEITKDNLEAVYGQSELTDICGIGERIKRRLNKIGIYSLLELRNASLTLLISEFGNCEGHFLKNVGLGLDFNSLNPFTRSPGVKSVGRQYCLPKNEYDKKIISQNIYELCEEVCIKLRRLFKKARAVGFYLSGDISLHGRKTYEKYFDTGKEMFDLSTNLFNLNSFKYVRRIGISAFNLENAENTPLSLFDSPKKDKLTSVIDKINDKFGDHTIRNGFLLHADKLTTVPNGFMADKYERTKLAEDKII